MSKSQKILFSLSSRSDYVSNLFLGVFLGMYSRHGQWGSNIMAMKNKNKQVSSKASGKKPMNMKKQKTKVGPSRIIEGSAPAAKSYKIVTSQPQIVQSGKSMRIRHREMVLSSIQGQTTFTVNNVLSLNPGLPNVFPWLSATASNWEMYRFNSLKAEYIPIAPSNTQGDVLLAPDYDASDPTPVNEQQAANNADSVMDHCWEYLCLTLNRESMAALGPRKYVRQGLVAGDIKTFDVGKIFVCTNNASAATPFGKLFLEYDVEFFVPQSSPNTDTVPESASLYNQEVNQNIPSGTPTPINFSVVSFDTLGVGAPAGGVFHPPAGCFKISASATVYDGTGMEQLDVLLELWKNGAPLPIPVNAQFAMPGGAQTTGHLSLVGILPCNGSDTFQIEVTATAATGPVGVLAETGQLLIELI